MSTNLWARLRQLFPSSPLLLAKVTGIDEAAGTSKLVLLTGEEHDPVSETLGTGTLIIARGTTVPVGSNAWVRDGVIESQGPSTVPDRLVVGKVMPPLAPLQFNGPIAAQAWTAGTPVSLPLAGAWSGAYGAPKFSIASGSLPVGVVLNPVTGIVSGTPTLNSVVTVVFKLTDAAARRAVSAPVAFTVEAGATAVPEATAIYNALTAYWGFEENGSGSTFADSFAANSLSLITTGGTNTTAANTASGRTGRAYAPQTSDDDCTAYAPRANTALDMANISQSIVFWLRAPASTAGSTRFVAGRWGASGGSVAAVRHASTTDTLSFIVSSDGSAVAASAESGVAPDPTEWRLVCATIDRENNIVRIRVKGATVDVNVTAAFTGALYTGTSTANFCFNNSLASDGTFFSGSRGLSPSLFDQACHVKLALTDAQFAYLYNAGAGRTFASLATDAGH